MQFLLVFAIPVITVALFLLMFQRDFGAQFFDVDAGADPLLWQHLFWIFGHPEVYILILPSFGIVSEVLPVFSRKPLFGYKFVVFSGAAIGFLGWGVWAHHMFASGLGPVSVAVFSVSTMLIAIPTGVKIVNWTLTMWGGKLRFTTAMLFAIGLIVEFTIGGLSGVTHSVSPSDTQQTDTYYIVAHFHYVLFGGAVFGIFAGFYYWWPKMFGKMLNETLGKWNFWLMVIGMNLTFGPMHILGLQGQPRRMVVYPEKLTGEGFFNLRFWNTRRASVGSYMLAIGVFLFIVNVWHTTRKGAAGAARPVGRAQPRVDDRQPAEGAQLRRHPARARARRVLPPQVRRGRHRHRPAPGQGAHRRGDPRRAGGQRRQAHPHAVAVVLADRAGLRACRSWPTASSTTALLTVVGGVILLLAIFGWALEPSVADDSDYDPPPQDGEPSKELRHWLRQRSSKLPPRTTTAIDTDVDGVMRRRHMARSRRPHATSTGLSNNKLAMWLFLGSECLLFGGLISTYMLYRGRHTGTPGPGQLYDIPLTSVSRASCC